METWIEILLLTWGAGLTMALGGLLAAMENIQPRWLEEELRHGIIAFGGGALLSAVCLVLVPEGIKDLTNPAIVFSFLSGGLFFAVVTRFVEKSGSSVSNLVAMLSDYVPEAIALGATMSLGNSGFLLAFLIAIQNLPEGFNAFREIKSSRNVKSIHILLTLFLLSFLGPISGLIGYYYLSSMPSVMSSILLFSSAGILYLIFKDIAPQAQLKKDWIPPLGAILGFLVGLIGHLLTT